jgi:Tol biopolymer transport system component
MDERQWGRVWELFRQASENPDREEFLASVADEAEVVDEVRAMLSEADEQTSTFESKTGTRFSRYEILSLQGRGGMGQVYSARDLELDRIVALKFLPPGELYGPDSESLIREAKAASALNHPNIITVYEVIRTGPELAIAMEYVEGTPLRAYCHEAQAMDRVRHWGGQIAQALAAAHGRRIVHRDIKPENVMIREDGIVKVLDFGIAGLADAEMDALVVGGTPRYMAPEQIQGGTATAASDVYALGVVLFELATGSKPSGGVAMPDELKDLVQRMMSPDPRQRPSAKDVAGALSGNSVSSSYRDRGPFIAAALVVLAAIGWWAYQQVPKPEAAFHLRPLTSFPGSKDFAKFSPDGSAIAFAWNGGTDNAARRIYVMKIGDTEARAVTSSERNDSNPVWSPDGTMIAFNRNTNEPRLETYVIPAAGGVEKRVWFGGPGVAWWPDGKSLVVTRSSAPKAPDGLSLVSVATGESRSLTTAPAGMSDGLPSMSPDGKWIGFMRNSEALDVFAVPTSGGSAPVQLTFDGRRKLRALAWTADSREIVYSRAREFGGSGLWRVAADGSTKPTALAGLLQFAGNPNISRSGKLLVYTDSWTDSNIYRYEGSGALTDLRESGRVIASSREDHSPSASPDGSRIVFVSNRSGPSELWTARKDGSGQKQLTMLGELAGSPVWSPDGKQIAFDVIEQISSLWLMDASGSTPPRRLTDFVARKPAWSPDGAWIYFTSSRGGSHQIWRIRPDGKDLTQITRKPSDEAHLSIDGRTLYFRTLGTEASLWQAPADGSGPEQAVQGMEGFHRLARSWGVAPKGIYFLSREAGGRSAPIRFFDFASRKVETLGIRQEELLVGSLELSADGRSLLVVRTDQRANDLMLIDNFR